MSRRGSVKQDPNGTWTLVADVGPEGGPRRQVRRRGFRTRKEAQADLTKILHEMDSGAFVLPRRVTVQAYLEG